jgi:TrpR-related protein YerC/YecD
MAKFQRYPKLDGKKIEEMIVDLCQAIALTRDKKEAAELLTDLLGKQELEMIAKRLRIAELLLENSTYDQINKELKVSFGTIARVQSWLQSAGEGYRAIINKTKSKRESREEGERPVNLRGIKKKYPVYFWPQIMFKYWVQNASIKEKQDMRNILAKVGAKTEMYRELENLLILNR